ncbi:hypothetical protein JXM67_14325 [candidate division WOR-3 bacterium]|nr:hypothetical protein [candidate division WOR-3 bacterium]
MPGFWCINLVTIGWFIVRILYPKALLIEKEEQEKEPLTESEVQKLLGLSLVELKRRALESLDLDISSNAIEVMEELSRRAKQNLNEFGNEQVARDCCNAIHHIGHHKSVKFKQVWETAGTLLMELDRHARSNGKYNFSHTAILPFLRNLFYTPSGAGYRMSSPVITELEDHFQNVFIEDLQNKEIDLQRRKDPYNPVFDGLDALLYLLYERMTDSKNFVIIQDKALEELRNSSLRNKYEDSSLFALFFRLIILRVHVTGNRKEELDIAQEYAELLAPKNPVELVDDAHNLIYAIERTNFIRGDLDNLFKELKQRFNKGTS